MNERILVGYVYNEEGYYYPREIYFTIIRDKDKPRKVEIGDIVAIEHPSKKDAMVYYQVIGLPLKRKARDYEEDLLINNNPLIDEEKNYPRARATQIGYIDEKTNEIMPLLEHVNPMQKVYKVTEEELKKLLKPTDESIPIGKIYPSWKLTLEIDLSKLIRQGLIVFGGVGTGKTTTLLNILYRVYWKIKKKRGKPHILIIDKDREYDPKLINEDEEVIADIPVEKITFGIEMLPLEKRIDYIRQELGFTKNQIMYKLIEEEILFNPKKYKDLQVSPDYIQSKIYPVLAEKFSSKKNELKDLQRRLETWRQRLENETEPEEEKLSIEKVIKIIEEKEIVRIDLSTTTDYNTAYIVLSSLLYQLYNKALTDKIFGLIIAMDEAHLFIPEGGLSLASKDPTSTLSQTMKIIATTGPRNGITPFLATQRPSLISKTITTQMGQNVIVHRVEDIDLGRVKEIVGKIAESVPVLPRGWALVKSQGTKIHQPFLVKIEPQTINGKPLLPASTGQTAYDRFLQ